MAHAFRITAALASAMADALDAIIDAGTAAVFEIYDGSQPATPETAVGAQVLLARLTFSATAFGAASSGVKTANAITKESSAPATGTASWFRVKTQAGGTAVFDGSVGTSGCDLNLNTTAIVTGSEVDITAGTVTQPVA